MKPNSILGKYLIKQIVWNFLSVLMMVLAIIFMFEVIDLLRRVADRPDIDWKFVLKMVVMKLPRTLDMILPFVMMIAAMVTFWRVSKSNEFVIIRVSGVSVWGFLMPIVFAVLVIGALHITLINPISAKMYEAFQTMDYQMKTKNPKAVLFSDKGLWIREATNENKVLVMQAKSVRQENENTLYLYDVSILELDRKSQILRRIDAFLAILNNGQFELKDVSVYEAGKPRVALNSVKYDTSITVDRIKENFVDPDAISFWDLPETMNFYKKSGFSVTKHQMRYLSLLAAPFMLCVMILVAAVFALRPNNRRGGVMFLIVGGITAGFLVYFSSQVIYAFGLNGYIPAEMAIWTPILITALVSVSVLLHLEDG